MSKKSLIVGILASTIVLFQAGSSSVFRTSSSNSPKQEIQTQEEIKNVEPVVEGATTSVIELEVTPTPTPSPTPTETPTPIPTQVITPTPVPTAQPVQNTGLSNDNYYTNSAGEQVHSPAYSNSVPEGATAKCKDGTYSFSQSRKGTCSRHGGVAQWL